MKRLYDSLFFYLLLKHLLQLQIEIETEDISLAAKEILTNFPEF
jgi:monomeric isocitrate dehydrogenase